MKRAKNGTNLGPSIAEVLRPTEASRGASKYDLYSREFSLPANLLAGIAGFLVFYAFRQAMTPVLDNAPSFFLYLVPVLAVSFLVGRVAGWTALSLAIGVSFSTLEKGIMAFRDDRPNVPESSVLAFSVGLVIVYVADRLRDELTHSARIVQEKESTLGLLDSVFEHSTVGKAVFDRDGLCVRVNSVLARFLNQREEDCIGISFAQLIPLASENHGVFRRVWNEKAPQSNIHVAFEDSRVRKGSLRYCEVSFYPVMARGEVYGIAATATDVTELRLAEMERERLLESERAMRNEAERANHVKEEFMAILSHELRTPLTTILGWTELAKERTNDPEFLASAIDEIAEATQTQVKMIEDLLDISRINTGKLSLEQTILDISDIVDAAVRLLKVKADDKQLSVQTRFDRRGLVFGDSGRLTQIFTNILNNAIKFTPNGGTITVTVHDTPDEATVSIADTGEGIEREVLPFVFERFRQAEMGRSRRFGGLGLGLAIVKQLVHLHGGSVVATSDGPGKGTTVTVRLPRADQLELNSERQKRTSPANDPTLGAVAVLVVDDDDATRHVVTLMLESVGARVTNANSGKAALKHLTTQRFDVILSDIGMPEIDGYELLAAVRALPDPIARRTPAVAISAFAREEDRRLSLKSGFVAHITKPLQTAELVRAIRLATLTIAGTG